MAWSGLRKYWRDEAGAVAGLYGVALIGLIAAAGVGFDYARLAGLDSELQNGADQAALAAATQLDKNANACARAGNAAVDMLRNVTMLANDFGGNSVIINQNNTISLDADKCTSFGGVRFWQDAAKTTAATTDATARFVEVRVDTRYARYAFTPIVGLVASRLNAAAFAGIGSAICKVPPLMMCQDSSWNTAMGRGDGLRLVAGQASGSSWVPGNFGYLDVLGNGASGLATALGADVAIGSCQSTESVTSKPGVQTSVTNAINYRFDIYDNAPGNYCTSTNGKCTPAGVIRSDFVSEDLGSPASCPNNKTPYSSPKSIDTGFMNDPAKVYLPDASGNVATPPAVMGLPRDVCHAKSVAGDCVVGTTTTSRLGNGVWDIDTYFKTNYGNPAASYAISPDGTWVRTRAQALATADGATSISRYDVYRAEKELLTTGTPTATTKKRFAFSTTSGSKTTNYYSYLGPQCGTVSTNPDLPDRRLTAVAVIDCADVSGKFSASSSSVSGVKVLKWLQVFFVEPSTDRARTNAADIYVEVVREVDLGDGDKNLPVRKDVPYLIE